jgi:hypothetical protein
LIRHNDSKKAGRIINHSIDITSAQRSNADRGRIGLTKLYSQGQGG